MWVDDFSEKDANTYLDKVGFTKDASVRRQLFDRVGTRPLRLAKLEGNPRMTVDELYESARAGVALACQNFVMESTTGSMALHEPLALVDKLIAASAFTVTCQPVA